MCHTVSIARNFSLVDNVDIFTFCDASGKAYTGIVYLRCNANIHFVIAKARVVPITSPTLPQLELISANLAARHV